jgi:hypothetical protein
MLPSPIFKDICLVYHYYVGKLHPSWDLKTKSTGLITAKLGCKLELEWAYNPTPASFPFLLLGVGMSITDTEAEGPAYRLCF